ncbi:MAG: HAMP domain-containing histidine kinase [Roseburia sp.]|nr:HAMP domain-containing histidine kinase [Roseburia sp.]MCM1097956.1 HAMP domain-containing histidine kinase [Ruminococcus flavefaciens]
MKDKVKKTLITGGLLLLAFLFCMLLDWFFDTALNGVTLNWLDRKFVSYNWQRVFTNSETQETGYFSASIRWGEVKKALYQAVLVLVVSNILICRLIALWYAGRREKKVIAEAGRMIGVYMKHDREITDVFPQEYALISAQVAEIKANMQRHEQMMKEEAARKNDLITYLAHDLKTPLTSVVGYLSLLEEAPEMPAEQKARYVHITLEKALRLERLINEFFEITRYNLQQIVLEKETLDLTIMLVQMTDEFYPILQQHQNTIRTELPEGGLWVYADAEKLARVFNNILKNAVAYSYPGTEIQILCQTVGERVRLTFRNRGKTIPAQKLDSIFEKFFRLDDARGTNNGGAGLGLAIAREIVTLHGGEIRAVSDNETTDFIVELPNIPFSD